MTGPGARERDQGIDLLGCLTRVRVVPVVEIGQARHAVLLARALADGGLTCLEITFRTAAAAEAITAVAAEAPDVLVGAGTVRTVEQVELAVVAGARFLVAPGLSAAVVARAHAHGVPMLPGVCTPTEIEQAAGLGLRLVKFFPAEAAGGVACLKALSGPFRDMRFVPTGGIGPGNLAAYLELPLVAACGGSWMTPPPLVAVGDFAAVTRLAAEAAQIAGIPRQDRS
ncbi:MAG TPA: bifunctional 4-hydroxy-2-oxoglutarate aldolase/2-dehydro-3-deoxy-phosphogluconate aldolase [Streptosporangiaceae bacterium]|nr:bifunctional 4-hydroxy-2-oxoglutarate aldolase/2-dehydro-3-deoxy-phosphogluconate aldolase [Streptosporangiaceae bacterium]